MSAAPPRRLRFSLRTLLIFVLLIGAGAALWTNRQSWRQTLTIESSMNWGASFTPDGHRAATINPNGSIEIRNFLSGTVLSITPRRGKKGWLNMSPDGRLLLQEVVDEGADLWNAETGEYLRTITSGDAAWFSPDSRWLLVYSTERKCHVVQADNGSPMFDYSGTPDYKWLPNARMAICSSDDLAVWNIENKSKETVLSRNTDGTSLLAASQDGNLLISSNSLEKCACIWDIRHSECIARLPHDSLIESAAFSADGKFVVTGADNSARVWDYKSGKLLLKFECYKRDTLIHKVGFAAGGRRILATDEDGDYLKTWDFDGKEQFGVENPMLFRKTPEGLRVLDRDGALWDIDNGRYLTHFSKIKKDLYLAEMSNDGGMIAIADGDEEGRSRLSLDIHIWIRRRPEQWWGLAWLPEFWLTVIFAIAFLWSVRRDAARK